MKINNLVLLSDSYKSYTPISGVLVLSSKTNLFSEFEKKEVYIENELGETLMAYIYAINYYNRGFEYERD